MYQIKTRHENQEELFTNYHIKLVFYMIKGVK